MPDDYRDNLQVNTNGDPIVLGPVISSVVLHRNQNRSLKKCDDVFTFFKPSDSIEVPVDGFLFKSFGTGHPSEVLENRKMSTFFFSENK